MHSITIVVTFNILKNTLSIISACSTREQNLDMQVIALKDAGCEKISLVMLYESTCRKGSLLQEREAAGAVVQRVYQKHLKQQPVPLKHYIKRKSYR